MAMSETKMFGVLKKLLGKDTISKLEETLIITDDDGYVLYGEYFIRKSITGYCVTKRHSFLEEEFYLLRNAVIYTGLSKWNKIIEAKHVLELDKVLQGTKAIEDLHKKLVEKTKKLDNKSLYYAKLQEDRVKKRILLETLDNYAKSVTDWQNKRFKQVAK